MKLLLHSLCCRIRNDIIENHFKYPLVFSEITTTATYFKMPAIRGADSKKKTRRHTRDLDQVHADLHDEKHLDKYKSTKVVEDLPGLGQWYCVECSKWFESELNYNAHTKAKPHKRR